EAALADLDSVLALGAAAEAVPAAVTEIVRRREAARARRDWAASDQLRADALGQGWVVGEVKDGSPRRKRAWPWRAAPPHPARAPAAKLWTGVGGPSSSGTDSPLPSPRTAGAPGCAGGVGGKWTRTRRWSSGSASIARRRRSRSWS